MTDDWKTRALRAEAEVVALKAALALSLRALNQPGHAVVHAAMEAAENGISSSSGADLLDAVRKAREALRLLIRDTEGARYTTAHDAQRAANARTHAELAESALSRFLPEGT